jgi:hypothetical protein
VISTTGKLHFAEKVGGKTKVPEEVEHCEQRSPAAIPSSDLQQSSPTANPSSNIQQ